MSFPKKDCDSIQMEISEALDDVRPLPGHVMAHVHGCAECEAFLAFWTEGVGRQLAQPSPPADIALRMKVLSLPQEAQATGINPQRKKYSIRGLLSAAAALAVFGLTAHSLLDVRRAPETSLVKQPHAGKALAEQLAQKEINALRSDLRKGVGALRGPVSSLNRLLD